MSESLSAGSEPVLRSPEEIERVKDYLDLQLLFAEEVASKKGEPIDEALLKYTNFHRRFGFGTPKKDVDPRWARYMMSLQDAGTHDERLQRTIDFYSKTSPEASERVERKFGCFNFDYEKDTKTVQIHFDNQDTNGPLSKERIPERLKELKAMFAYIKSHFHDAEFVKGHSWLYNIDAYRRLFPKEYADTRVPSESSRLNGTSRWGQFLDSERKIKNDLREEFLHNLKNLDPNDITKVFPMQALRVNAPIEAFYEKYGIE